MSKEKAARISNAGREASGKGGKSKKYEEWKKSDLLNKARGVGLENRSKMNKSELIDALRNHSPSVLIDALRHYNFIVARSVAWATMLLTAVKHDFCKSSCKT